ncbi:MAG TPA: TetR/AcrR family transcriptional regulator [Clostridiales bacterium]|nr:TetR/AcrR family transcriptional regulator [Clostridiales bacterium]
MPPTVRFTRDAVLHAACQLMRREGMEALNARAIAKELGGSTQPIFRLFTNMEDLHRELILYVARQFQAHAEADMAQSDSPYIQLCTTYLLYGRDEPELFKLLFMRDRVSEGQYSDQTNFGLVFNIIKKETPLDDETALRFFERTWLFIHGLAVCIATKYIPCQDERYLISMVKEAYNAAVKMMNLEGVLKLQEI